MHLSPNRPVAVTGEEMFTERRLSIGLYSYVCSAVDQLTTLI